MPKLGQSALTLRKDVYEKFKYTQEQMKKLDPKLEISVFLDILLESFEEAKRLLPPLQHLGSEGNEIHIFDRSKDRLIVVRARDKDLFCDKCQTNNCMHIGFAMSMDEVKRAIVAGNLKKVK